MKNYINIAGMSPRPPIIYHHPDYGDIIITSLYPCRHGNRLCVSALMADGKKILLTVDTRPDVIQLIEAEKAEKERLFLARVPGIDDYLSIITAHSDYNETLIDIMDDEYNDGVCLPSHPIPSIAEARMRYPIARAYVHIISMADADPSSQIGYIRCRAGDAALVEITQGADIIAAAKKMSEKIKNTK